MPIDAPEHLYNDYSDEIFLRSDLASTTEEAKQVICEELCMELDELEVLSDPIPMKLEETKPGDVWYGEADHVYVPCDESEADVRYWTGERSWQRSA